MSMLDALKRLAGEPGNVREMVQLLETVWREDASGFEKLLMESTPAWKEYEYIPLALVILTTERDDARLRQIVRAVSRSGGINPSEEASFTLVGALWGDEWAKEDMARSLTLSMEKAIRSEGAKFQDALWSLRRSAMVGQRGDGEDLDCLRRRLKEKGPADPECIGMLDALAERDQRGLEGLAQRLECCLRRRKTADADVAACFLLGATGDSRYASLFLRLWTELRGSDFWTDGLRRCALISFSYAWLLQGPVQEVIEEWLAKQQKTLTKGSWFASSHTPEFLAICDILWNVQEALRPGIVTVLRAVARGARKWDAKEGIALLLLKGLEIPPDSTLDQESFDVKSAKDLMQYDKVLNFTYYWRCRAKKSGEKAGTLR